MLKFLRKDLYYPFRIFTFLALFFLIGVLLATFIRLDFHRSEIIFLFILVLCLFSALINFLLKNRFLVLLSFWLFSLIFGISYYSFYDWLSKPILPYGKTLQIEGIIAKKPEIDWEKQKIVIKVQNFGDHKKLKSNNLVSIVGGKSKIDFVKNDYDRFHFQDKNIFLSVSLPHYPKYYYGDTIEITGTILQPKNFSEEFDYVNYLKRYHIFGIINGASDVNKLGSNKIKDIIFRNLYLIPDKFESVFNQTLGEPHASLASGILLGVKRNISDNLLEVLKVTGLTHIIALSGYNVTIIISVFAVFLISIVGRKGTFFYGSMLVVLFVLMTGASMSVVRAAIFSLLILYGRTIGRQADETNIMLLAALAMVLTNPYIIRYDLGFQLSFLAFCGLIYFSKPIEYFLAKKFKNKLLNLEKPLAETLGAQFAVIPLLFLQFGSISLISPVANLLVVWIVPYVMLFSFITGIFGIFFLPFAQIIALLLWPMINYIIVMVTFLSKLPFANINF